MKKLLTTGKTVALAAAIVSVAQLASASSVTYTYTGETAGGLTIDLSVNGHSEYAQVGQFVMTTTTPGFSSTLLTYCTDIGTSLANGPSGYKYTPTALSAATDIAGASPVWVANGLENAAKLWFNNKAAATTAVQTAGLQLAIWELLYNTYNSHTVYSDASFGSGNKGFQILSSNSGNVGAAEDYAEALLNSFSTSLSDGGTQWLAPTASNGSCTGSQGLLYVPPGGTSLVPDVSSTLPLFGLGLAALGAARRKLFGKA